MLTVLDQAPSDDERQQSLANLHGPAEGGFRRFQALRTAYGTILPMCSWVLLAAGSRIRL
jgi:hypothetical protein